jgi:o-succinylbenzoate synthase
VIRPRAIELRLVRLPLRSPFRTSFGEEAVKEAILVRAQTDDGFGWGECAAA